MTLHRDGKCLECGRVTSHLVRRTQVLGPNRSGGMCHRCVEEFHNEVRGMNHHEREEFAGQMYPEDAPLFDDDMVEDDYDAFVDEMAIITAMEEEIQKLSDAKNPGARTIY